MVGAGRWPIENNDRPNEGYLEPPIAPEVAKHRGQAIVRVRGINDLCPRIGIAMDEDHYPVMLDFLQQCSKPSAVIVLAHSLRLVVWQGVQPERQFIVLGYVWVGVFSDF